MGSAEGGENWAAIASLIVTCKLNAVDSQRYLTDLLTSLVNRWHKACIDELMPWCWTNVSEQTSSAAIWSALTTEECGLTAGRDEETDLWSNFRLEDYGGRHPEKVPVL